MKTKYKLEYYFIHYGWRQVGGRDFEDMVDAIEYMRQCHAGNYRIEVCV